MFGMGIGELVVVIVLLVFGPGRLPEMMGHLGKGVQEFKKGLREPPEEVDAHAARRRRAMASMCGVCGNMSTGCTHSTR